MVAKIKKWPPTDKWVKKVHRSRWHQNILWPLAFLSLLLHKICDTTSSALTALSMDVMAGGDATAAATDPVALVDAVDELRVRGHPRETESCRVDRFGLHVAGGDGGYWDGRGEEEKGRQRGRKGRGRKKRRSVKTKKQRCESTFQLTAGSLPASILMSVLIAAAQVRADTAITLFLMTLRPNTRALCGFVCDCVSCLWISGGCHTLCGLYKEELMLMQLNISQHRLLVHEFSQR